MLLRERYQLVDEYVRAQPEMKFAVDGRPLEQDDDCTNRH